MGLSLRAYLALARAFGKTEQDTSHDGQDVSRIAHSDASPENDTLGENNPIGTEPSLPVTAVARTLEDHTSLSLLRPAQSDLVWLYAEDPETGRALQDLAHRLVQVRPETHVIASGAIAQTSVVTQTGLPAETQRATEQFIQKWRPGIALVTGRKLRPSLMTALSKAGTVLIYVDAQDQPFLHPGPRWLPDPTPAALALFSQIHTRDAAATKRLRRLGIPASKIRQSGRLYPAARPPETPLGGRDDVASFVAGRPIWLAAKLHSGETSAILEAHRMVAKQAHRLLLVIVPADFDQHEHIRAQIDDAGLRCCDWDLGDEPDDMTSVLITEGPEDLGLWYRIAPLAFLGGTLTPDATNVSPMDAAALGAAILHGPHIKQHIPAYTRLSEHLAARQVRDAQSLGDALSQLIAPERSAAMALAGWDVVTQGASLFDQLCKDICDILDDREEGTDART